MYDLGKKKKINFNPSGSGTVEDGLRKMKEDMQTSYKGQTQSFKPFSTSLRDIREDKEIVKPLTKPMIKLEKEEKKKEEKEEIWSSDDWLDWAHQLLDEYGDEPLTPKQMLPDWVLESYRGKAEK